MSGTLMLLLQPHLVRRATNSVQNEHRRYCWSLSVITGPWRPLRRTSTCQCRRDPLELEIWNSWQDTADDWETEKFTEDELVDILFDEDGSPETAAQNILAIALSFLLVLAVGSILWRLLLVSWALFSAAARYSIVAVLLLILAVVFF